jgi:hypothetical protein
MALSRFVALNRQVGGRRRMATAAGIVTVVMGFVAAYLLYEAIAPAPRNDKRDRTMRRERLRTLGVLAALVAVVAAYVAAIW